MQRGSPWLQGPGLSPPTVLPGGPDPTEGTLRMARVLYIQGAYQEML